MEGRAFRKRCKTVGCPNLHHNKNGYCDECTAKWLEKHPRQRGDDSKRPNANKRGYNYRWTRFARRYLESHPLCALCGAPSSCVDHKDIPADVMLDVYGTFDYDESHYQALCHRCNTLKGKKEDKRIRKVYENDKEWLKNVQS